MMKILFCLLISSLGVVLHSQQDTSVSANDTLCASPNQFQYSHCPPVSSVYKYPNGVVKKVELKTCDTSRVKLFYSTGELNVEMISINDTLTGDYLTYYRSGVLKSKENFYQNERQDSAFYFYPSGNLKRKGVFEEDFYWGLWLTYYENGRLKNSGSYYYGNPEGVWTFYDKKGRRIETITYKRGKKHGERIIYKPRSQKVKSVFLYQNDELAG